MNPAGFSVPAKGAKIHWQAFLTVTVSAEAATAINAIISGLTNNPAVETFRKDLQSALSAASEKEAFSSFITGYP